MSKEDQEVSWVRLRDIERQGCGEGRKGKGGMERISTKGSLYYIRMYNDSQRSFVENVIPLLFYWLWFDLRLLPNHG